MRQRINALTFYLWRSLAVSPAGGLLLLGTFAFWLIAFNPRNGAIPDPAYFISLIGMLGAVLSLITTLIIAAIAYRQEHATLLARANSRVEVLAAVLAAALLFSGGLQIVFAATVVLLPGGPSLRTARLIELPPLWWSLNLIIAVLTLHASDLVAKGWSRVLIFGTLVLLLFGQQVDSRMMNTVARQFRVISSWLFNRELGVVARPFSMAAGWLQVQGVAVFERWFGFAFWPFRSMMAAIRDGGYSYTEAIAPAILVLYATIFFLLAADFFATKDLHLEE